MANSWKRTLALAAAPLLAAAFAFAPASASADTKTTACQRGAKANTCKTLSPAAAKAAAKTAASGKSTAGSSAKSSGSKAAAKPAATRKAAASNSKSAASTKAAARPAAKSASKQTNTRNASPARRAERRAASVAAAASPASAVAARAAVATTAAAAAHLPAALAANTTRAEAASLRSNVAYVQDLETSTVLFSKNEGIVAPIASISKLMTALVVVDANQPLDEVLEITSDDIDRVRHAPSRLTVGTRLTRADMLHLALMSSENRAANALGRHYPGGLKAFARAMNSKARALGMYDTNFIEPTGLSSQNVSSPRDLVRMIRAAAQRPLIHRYTTNTEYQVRGGTGRVETFRNTNALVRNDDWDIKVSKTGYINEAGECLVMVTRVNGRDLAIVLLNSQGKLSRIGDAVRLRSLLQKEVAML